MAHRFLIKEIALQAGVGMATVDRVLNGREHVREHTRQRVQQAIKDLEKQQFQLASSGRKLVVDVIVEAPRRFSDEIRDALEAELPALLPAVFRPRFLMQDTMTTAEVVEALRAIGRRGSHGVFLKARDVPATSDAIAELQRRGIPVVTIFTDIPDSARIAYAGLDNRVAGATAAYLIGQWLGARTGNVLVTMSDDRFRGEEQRELSFCDELRKRHPKLTLIDASGADGSACAARRGNSAQNCGRLFDGWRQHRDPSRTQSNRSNTEVLRRTRPRQGQRPTAQRGKAQRSAAPRPAARHAHGMSSHHAFS
jgi:LacI family transcriptional regulator